jgi:transposase
MSDNVSQSTQSSTIRQPRRRDLTRDERLHVGSLWEVGYTHEQIRQHLLDEQGIDASYRQIKRACAAGHPTLQKKRRMGRNHILNEWQVDELITYISSSRARHLLPFLDLAVGPFAH